MMPYPAGSIHHRKGINSCCSTDAGRQRQLAYTPISALAVATLFFGYIKKITLAYFLVEADMHRSLLHASLFAALCLMPSLSSSNEKLHSINAGIGGLNPMPHCEATIYTLEYEQQTWPAIALLGRISGVDYTSDETNYVEEGTLQGVDLGMRYYPSTKKQGFYMGASAGYWTGDWEFEKNATKPIRQVGEADSRSVRVNFDLGYRYPIKGTTISVIPKVDLGKFFSSSSCDYTAPATQIGLDCDQESVVNGYIFASVLVGFEF